MPTAPADLGNPRALTIQIRSSGITSSSTFTWYDLLGGNLGRLKLMVVSTDGGGEIVHPSHSLHLPRHGEVQCTERTKKKMRRKTSCGAKMESHRGGGLCWDPALQIQRQVHSTEHSLGTLAIPVHHAWIHSRVCTLAGTVCLGQSALSWDREIVCTAVRSLRASATSTATAEAVS